MSLINDALKRAKEAQSSQPPPLAGAPLHATSSNERSSLPWMVAGLILISLMLVLGVVLFARLNNHETAPVKISVADTATTPQSAALQKNPQPAPVEPTSLTIISNTSEPIVVVATNVPITPPQISPGTNVADVSNAPVVAVDTAPPKPRFRLQGIFYRPNNPSAVINGKILFIGGQLGEARVVAITPESATLIVAGQTNVLSLP